MLHRVKGEKNILHTAKGRKTEWIGHILRRNCLLRYVIEGKLEGRIKVKGRRGRRRKQLLDDLEERREHQCKLEEDTLACTLWRNCFGGRYGPVLRQVRD